MIPIRPQPEPADFQQKVRERGARFLDKYPHPIHWKNREYWRDALADLYEAYGHICSYSCEWISCTTGVATVDHFVPKSVNPQLAYDWKNFRLSCLKMNGRKGDFQDVLDPFEVQLNWFLLRFPSLLVEPNPTLEALQREKVYSTINRLKLNDDDTCVQSRLHWIEGYCSNNDFEFLRRRAPFVAYELQRQKLLHKIASMIKKSPSVKRV